MIALLRRDFTVEMPLAKSWEHLARVEQWPTWAKHIKRVNVEPPGQLAAGSTGVFYLRNGVKTAFKMIEFNPHRNWAWSGRFLWLRIRYDHIFQEIAPERTKLTWIVEGEGIGVSVFGRLFAKVYSKNLDQAIPSLVAQMNGQP